MSKKEIIWREILIRAREKKAAVLTQKELAATFGFSLSTVFNALKIPRASNIITVTGRNFRLNSYQKLLYLWASCRSLPKEIIFRTKIDADAGKIESLMPPDIVFGLYSAATLYYKKAPADYDHVYIYCDKKGLNEVLGRLPPLDKKNKNYNFFVLQKDQWLDTRKDFPPEQAFVDIWNAPEWYAKDFLRAIEEQLPV